MMLQNHVLSELLEIKFNENKSLLHELVDSYFEQTPDRLVRLRSAIKNKNIDMISRIAHALKSSSSFLGLRKMVILCSDLEKLNRNGSSTLKEEYYLLLNVLEESFDEYCNELKIYLIQYKIH